MSEPEYTLTDGAPAPVARDSARAEEIRGGGLILLEVVDVGDGRTLTIEGRSCLSYVVEYRLILESAPGSPEEGLSVLAEVLTTIEPANRSPVPLRAVAAVLLSRGGELLDGEMVPLSDNPFGETIRVDYLVESDTVSVSLVYVVGL